MSAWTELRDTAEAAAVLAGNYYLPGSSIFTKHLVSDGAQEKLDSPVGQLAQLGTGGAGGMEGNFANWTGGNGGFSLPSFGGSGATPAADATAGGVDWANAPDQSAAETSRLLRQDATANGTPVDNSGIDWGQKGQNFLRDQAIQKGIDQVTSGSGQQKDLAEQEREQRRRQLERRAQELRQQIANLRQQIAVENSNEQQGNQSNATSQSGQGYEGDDPSTTPTGERSSHSLAGTARLRKPRRGAKCAPAR